MGCYYKIMMTHTTQGANIMTTENPQIAETIIAQLGGFGRLSAMVGAHTLIDHGNGVSFKFKGCRKANYCRITLDPSDTYSVEISKVTRARYAKIVDLDGGVYADALRGIFQDSTGLYLSL